MEPCLAATGADPTLPIVLAAALLALGVVVAAVAIRRGKASAALLVLALPFLVGASLLGSASPALAQPGVPCPTPTPTPTCEPAEAVLGGEFVTENEWNFDQDVSAEALFTDADTAAYTTTWNAVNAIDPGFTLSFSIGAQQLGTTTGPVPFETGFGIDGATVSIPWTDYLTATGALTGGIAWVDVTFTYDNGCGGELSTTLRYIADVPPTIN